MVEFAHFSKFHYADSPLQTLLYLACYDLDGDVVLSIMNPATGSVEVFLSSVFYPDRARGSEKLALKLK